MRYFHAISVLWFHFTDRSNACPTVTDVTNVLISRLLPLSVLEASLSTVSINLPIVSSNIHDCDVVLLTSLAALAASNLIPPLQCLRNFRIHTVTCQPVFFLLFRLVFFLLTIFSIHHFMSWSIG